MAFDVSKITKFTDETSQALVKAAVLAGRTVERATVIPGIKYKTNLNLLVNTPTIHAATCGFATAAGDVEFQKREIEVAALEVKEILCAKDLEQYWLSSKMKPGAATDVTLGQILADSYTEKIKKGNEYTLWQGTKGAGAYPNFDGYLVFGTIANGAIDGTAAAGPHASANILAHIETMVGLVPEDILMENDLTLYMSFATYNTYTSALRTANLFHYNGAVGSDYSTVIPGTNIKAEATVGLNGTDVLFLTSAKNLVVGTDMLNEEEKFQIAYYESTDDVRVNIQWKMGAQIYFPQFCVTNQA